MADYSLNSMAAFGIPPGEEKPKQKPKVEGPEKKVTQVGELPQPDNKPFSGKLQVIDPTKPLEVPEDAGAYQQYTNNFAKKYNKPENFGFVNDRADWGLFVNTESDETNKPVGQAVKDSAKKQGIRPELLFSSAMEEGMRKALPKNDGDKVQFSGSKNYPVDGYTSFGLDDFAGNFKELVKKGYLSSDFKNKFEVAENTNEKGRKVMSANFKTIDDALEAKAAVLKDASEKVATYASKNKIPLSDAAKEFFTLATFNAGEEGARKMMYSFQQQGLLDGDKFLKTEPKSWNGVWKNVMKRIVMANALKQENLFQEQ